LKRKQNVLLVIALIVIVAAFVLIKSSINQTGNKSDSQVTSEESKANLQDQVTEKLPMLVDLGRGTCIPCKMMLPILQQLQEEYKGRAIIKIIDIRYDPEPARVYKIRLIPTQIFFDVQGREVYRHEGFMDKSSIKQKLQEIGAK